MKSLTFCIVCIAIMVNVTSGYAQNRSLRNRTSTLDKVQALKDTLHNLYEQTQSSWLKLTCESITRVIDSRQLTSLETSYVEDLYDAFINTNDPFPPTDINTYIQRRRPLILSWVSPSDGSVSLSWLQIPRNWTPGKKYPVYIELHGLWNVASNAFQYMVYPYVNNPSNSNAFEDGYHLRPWGRGNYWYQGSSETDIWECISALENMVETDSSRKYLCGHSMGGYGAMTIAGKSPGVWAAVGIYAGALGYYPSPLNISVAEALKDVPMYFVCGTEDNLYNVNVLAYKMVENEGNKNVQFSSFNGGHEYREGDVFAMYMWMKNFVNDDVITKSNNFESKRFSFTNPVTSSLEIRYPESLNYDTLFCICDLAGNLVYSSINAANEGRYTMNISGLIPGTYILKVTGKDWTDSGILVKL